MARWGDGWLGGGLLAKLGDGLGMGVGMGS